jgi:hypothetical protein
MKIFVLILFLLLSMGLLAQSTAITDNKFQIPVIGGFAQTLQFFNPSTSQPFQHMGIPGNLQDRRSFLSANPMLARKPAMLEVSGLA